MQVTVRFHAQAADLVGAAETAVRIDDAATCGDLKRALVVQHPELKGLAAVSALATDREYLADGAPVRDRSLHLIPPVSGG